MKHKFPEWLRATMAERGWTIMAMHRATGIPRRTLYNWADGTRTPRIDSLEYLADQLGMELVISVKEKT